VFFGGFLIVSLRFWVLAAVPPFATVLAMIFLAGFGAGPINPILMALELERIPAALRGRVLGTITAFAWVAMPLGMLVGGYLLEVFDVRAVLIGIGVAYLGSILAFLFHPATGAMDQRRTAGGAP
jgi:MFS family permease